MNVYPNTVFTTFDLDLSALCCETFSHFSTGSNTGGGILGISVGGIGADTSSSSWASANARIDLEKLAGRQGDDGALWNVELKRSQSLEATHCTFRLPPIIIGNKFLVSNGVASIRPSGTVHVLGSGSVKGVLGIAEKVRKLLSALLRKDNAGRTGCFNSREVQGSDKRSSRKRGRRTDEEEYLWHLATAFCAEGHHVDSSLLLMMEKAGDRKDLVQCSREDVFDSPSLFTPPSVLFARVAIYPSKCDLRQLRSRALQEQSEGSLRVNKKKDVHGYFDNKEGLFTPACMDYTTLPSHCPLERMPLHTEEQQTLDHLSKTGRRILRPVSRKKWSRSASSYGGKQSGLFFFNATGEESIRWISRFLGEEKAGRSIKDDEDFLISSCPPHRVHASFIRQQLYVVRHYIIHASVHRLTKQKGIQIRVQCRNIVSKIGAIASLVREGVLSTSSTSTTNSFFPSSDPLFSFPQGHDAHSAPFAMDSVTLDYFTPDPDRQQPQKSFLMSEEDGQEDNDRIKVDCTLFSSGMGSVVSKSLDAIHFFIREIVIFLLLVHAEF